MKIWVCLLFVAFCVSTAMPTHEEEGEDHVKHVGETEHEDNELAPPTDTKDEETEAKSEGPAVETSITDPEDYQSKENEVGGSRKVIKTTTELDEEEDQKSMGKTLEAAEECEMNSLETLKGRLYIPLTYSMARSTERCRLSCEISDKCAAVGVILYEKIPPQFRKMVSPNLGPKDILCVEFVRSLIAGFIKSGPFKVLYKRTTYSFIYEKHCKPANLTSKPMAGESKVCPGLGRKPTKVDEYYEISGAAGGTYTETSRADCEKRCMTDLKCTAMWYKPQMKKDNCQLYQGKTQLVKPNVLSFSKDCDKSGVCTLKLSKYKILGPGEPMGVPKLDACKHRCVSENWCKGVRWIPGQNSKCHFLINSKNKLEKNLITVYKCHKSINN